jgi:hypothetical protein
MMEPTPFLIDDTVKLTLNTWGRDADGSRIVASTVAVPDVPCVVLPGPPRVERKTDPDTGLDRVTRATPYTVEFPLDVGLNVEDLITWVDPADRTHTLIVAGYNPPAGRGGFWVAACEEHA